MLIPSKSIITAIWYLIISSINTI